MSEKNIAYAVTPTGQVRYITRSGSITSEYSGATRFDAQDADNACNVARAAYGGKFAAYGWYGVSSLDSRFKSHGQKEVDDFIRDMLEFEGYDFTPEKVIKARERKRARRIATDRKRAARSRSGRARSIDFKTPGFRSQGFVLSDVGIDGETGQRRKFYFRSIRDGQVTESMHPERAAIFSSKAHAANKIASIRAAKVARYKATGYGDPDPKVAYKIERVKAGGLKRNPAPRRVGTSTRAPSMITGRAPSKRLIARRRKNVRVGYYPNPGARDQHVDTPLAQELASLATSKPIIYYTNLLWIAANLAAKKVKGTYDPELAIKGWENGVRTALEHYRKDYRFTGRVNAATKRAAAIELKQHYRALVDNLVLRMRQGGVAKVRKELHQTHMDWADGKLDAYPPSQYSPNPRHVTARVRKSNPSRGFAIYLKSKRMRGRIDVIVALGTSQGEYRIKTGSPHRPPFVFASHSSASDVAAMLSNKGYKSVIASTDTPIADVKAALA